MLHNSGTSEETSEDLGHLDILEPLLFDVHPSFFTNCDLLKIGEFRKRIEDDFTGKNPMLGPLENKCKAAADLLLSSTKELDQAFIYILGQGIDEFYDKKFCTLFAWAGKGNRVDLLYSLNFKTLFQRLKTCATVASVVAAAFSSKEFLVSAIQYGLLDEESLGDAVNTAAANADNALLTALWQICPKYLATNKLRTIDSDLYYIQSSAKPLFWSIRNGHNQTTKCLLDLGVSSNEKLDSFGNDSYLQLAVRCGNIEGIKLLISNKANVNHQNTLCQTALHTAAHRSDLEAMKILITYGADIELIDDKGKKALDIVTDESVLNEVYAFVASIKYEPQKIVQGCSEYSR